MSFCHNIFNTNVTQIVLLKVSRMHNKILPLKAFVAIFYWIFGYKELPASARYIIIALKQESGMIKSD